MSRRDDADEIDAGLRANIEGVLDAFAPGWERKGVRAHPTGDTSSSFMVTLTGRHRGGWNRFSQKLGGGPISLIAYLLNGQCGEPTKGDLRVAFQEARRFLGMEDGGVDSAAALEAQRRAREARERDRAAAEAREQEELVRRQDNAWALWELGRDPSGTPGELYLKNRVADVSKFISSWPPSIRFAPRVRHDLNRQWSGALLCRVDGPDGDFLGLTRIYVTDDGKKAFGRDSKLTMGPIAGGAVRLWEPVDGEVSVCEGVETAFGVYLLSECRRGVWAMLGTSGMRGLELPFEISSVRIWPDGDMWREKYDERAGEERLSMPPGKTAAGDLRERLVAEGIRVIEEEADEFGADFLDIWNFRQSVLEAA
ncbi:DUF7146 domain-containing protein [Acuticoccus sediminis]|uniref:DUF7146 domain-containing protein n=1 Tax=Acuticoccus sediminis TaxID=2184697 RepID=UPI001CFEB287|nr:toprim domain-containing protein [Acuticoccus sediminis]